MGARASANDIVPTMFRHVAATGRIAEREVTRTVPINRRGSVDTATRRFRSVPLLTALSFAASVAACGLLDPEIGDTGTIVFQQIEGGCWLIDTATERYYPINLPANLQVEGLQVEFEGVSRADLATFCPGLIIELRWIGELEG